ncbi:hypothetical protein WT02_13210 [Burkholderia stagnalis]|nr:hypothetical protein WT03_22250 [Burkholderia stagnalis]KVL98176.1 hypothetical protein WT02_13210 [Burkholderia stagnalis]KVM15660.1 hypothetical protein WT04_04710 [Burkholderia stagnalis]
MLPFPLPVLPPPALPPAPLPPTPPPAYTCAPHAVGLAAHDDASSASIIMASTLADVSGAAFCATVNGAVKEVLSFAGAATGPTAPVSCATAYEQQHANAATASKVAR